MAEGQEQQLSTEIALGPDFDTLSTNTYEELRSWKGLVVLDPVDRVVGRKPGATYGYQRMIILSPSTPFVSRDIWDVAHGLDQLMLVSARNLDGDFSLQMARVGETLQIPSCTFQKCVGTETTKISVADPIGLRFLKPGTTSKSNIAELVVYYFPNERLARMYREYVAFHGTYFPNAELRDQDFSASLNTSLTVDALKNTGAIVAEDV